MVGQLIWVLKVMPETKGVPLEEMEYQLGLVHDDPARGAVGPHHDALRDDRTEQVPTRTGARPDGSHIERMDVWHPQAETSPASW